MIPLVVASERGGWLNRTHGDTRRGLWVWCCGASGSLVRRSGRSQKMVLLGEVAWDGLP